MADNAAATLTVDKSRNTDDERYSKLTIGVCPDQWGCGSRGTRCRCRGGRR
ncbi:hypothetical protein [Arsenicicoccus piscis]|uniref:Uncharacterized protein n=1 Tax=Arsenicicoccus piscis TaxID=673954 RepID=A0ABQ6HT05_9MICO|nr:hypothetical protein GCM10025862_36490 [Arsenicicoccus piscis]